VAALIKQDVNLDTDLEPGGRGEFSVWLDEVKIAEKSRTGFPSDQALLDAIKTALTAQGLP
jgi:predicted Rdx family selenoprotein